MIPQIMKYLTVYLLSTVKFIGGPVSGVAAGLTWMETFIFTVLGMMTTVIIFSLLGENAKKKFLSKFRKNKKLFTPRNRRLVAIWRKYGLIGVAFLTPIILSPIIGTMVATSFGEPKKRIFTYMLCSALFWGVIFSFVLTQVRTIDF
jgi:uncharacterized membrane protein